MLSLPAGTLTFPFVNIEGLTALPRHLGDSQYTEILAEHPRLLRAGFAKSNGQEIPYPYPPSFRP